MINHLDPTVSDCVTEVLNRLPFVLWDRLSGENDHFSVYGWIDREDAYKDFVLVEFWVTEKPDKYNVSWNYDTSSAEYSKEIGELLEIDGHFECQRVEDLFTAVRSTKIEAKS